MLKRLEITNFKSFKNTLIFDLSKTKNYTFNQACILDSIVNKAIIYGKNASGKSNLGLALFDIIGHTTDKYKNRDTYVSHYVYAGSTAPVTFSYTFVFNGMEVIYQYQKQDYDHIITETLSIDGETYLHIDRKKSNVAEINFTGTESLAKQIDNDKLSLISYVKSNANLDKRSKASKAFYQFIEFLNGMLYFRSLGENTFIGLQTKKDGIISEGIIAQDKVQEFEAFLNQVGINCKLQAIHNELYNAINGELIPFFEIASSGTKALAVFYYWLISLETNNATLLFIDEFDAFYHQELSQVIVELLRQNNIQTILTTHNTSIMTNKLLRPDCYFVINNKTVKSLPELTEKELRIAHSLEKMYRGHAFDK